MSLSDPRQFLTELFSRAVDAARPGVSLAAHLPDRPKGRTVVVGAGKAAAAMAAALEDAWDGPLEGLVVTRYGHGLPTRQIDVVEAAHPVPDLAGQDASRQMMELVSDLSADDLVIALISGGGSALLSLPAPGISLTAKQDLNSQLLASGAPIDAINTVRKHLSAIKGGRLAAAAHPARVVTLAISDVPGDDPSVVASGPTVADATTAADAEAILERYNIVVPQSVRDVLRGPDGETPSPGDPRLAGTVFTFVATPLMALRSAAQEARKAGIAAHVLSDAVEGEAREVARPFAAMARHIAAHRDPFVPPCVLISGGETTVTVRGAGRGGRNAEFALSLAVALDGAPGIHGIACDTDGIDGIEDNAGAIVTPDTLARAAAGGLDPAACLANNDAYRFFAGLDDLVVTGPTLTNVNDFRAILILGAEDT